MFLAPALYGLHAVLTGAAMVTMDLLGCRLGFGFSAGLFDYLLNFDKPTRPLLLLPVGLAYFGLYYGLFRYCIVRFDLRTPGREREEAQAVAAAAPAGPDGVADAFIAALGGAANFESVDACTTRLRLVLREREAIDANRLRQLGASGTVKVGAQGLQVVIGPIADQVAGEMRARLKAAAPAAQAAPAEWLAALGGAGNVTRVEPLPGRVLLTVKDARRVDAARLLALGARAVGTPSASSVHLLHARAEALGAELAPLLA